MALEPERACRWYVCEDKEMDIVPCDSEDGFCLVQDFFTECCGRCEMFDER